MSVLLSFKNNYVVVNFINILEQLLCKYSFTKKLQSQIVTREKLCKTLLYEKVMRKMLMKLIPVLSNTVAQTF